MQVNGKITNVRTEQKTSKSNGRPFFVSHLTVEGFDNEINVGWEKGFAVGGIFNKDVVQTKFGWELNKTGVHTVASAPKAVETKYSGGGIRNATYPVPPMDPQNIIINQNALAHAVKVVEIYHSQWKQDTPVVTIEHMIEQVLSVAPKMAAFSSGRLTQEAYEKLVNTPELQQVIANKVA